MKENEELRKSVYQILEALSNKIELNRIEFEDLPKVSLIIKQSIKTLREL